MIKTQTQDEKNFLREILPHYYKHLRNNPHSFVTHFYGMYRVKIPDLGKSIHFVIMKSVFNTEKEIHKIWDLKGSTLGRRSKRGEGVHKDLDFVDEGRKLYVGPDTKEAIMEQLKKDAAFLAEMRIMDYSLLIGVHVSANGEDSIRRHMRQLLLRTNTPMRRQQKRVLFDQDERDGALKRFIENAKEYLGSKSGLSTSGEERTHNLDDSDSDDSNDGKTGPELQTVLSESSLNQSNSPNPFTSRDDFGIESRSGDSREIYFAGIIDILQLYNTRKWGETMMRKAVGNSEKAISCVNPEAYADRFIEFLDGLIE